jgi:hypothetical protein
MHSPILHPSVPTSIDLILGARKAGAVVGVIGKSTALGAGGWSLGGARRGVGLGKEAPD